MRLGVIAALMTLGVAVVVVAQMAAGPSSLSGLSAPQDGGRAVAGSASQAAQTDGRASL
jgi:hypothetical protein